MFNHRVVIDNLIYMHKYYLACKKSTKGAFLYVAFTNWYPSQQGGVIKEKSPMIYMTRYVYFVMLSWKMITIFFEDAQLVLCSGMLVLWVIVCSAPSPTMFSNGQKSSFILSLSSRWMFCMCLWGLWNERNNVLWNNSSFNPGTLFRRFSPFWRNTIRFTPLGLKIKNELQRFGVSSQCQT